jgi:hypothetical protein
MKALISTIEPSQTGYRIAQVEPDDAIFPVAEPELYWVDCADDVVADQFWFDPSDSTIKPVPSVPLAQPTKEELMAKLAEIQSQIQGLAS